MQHVTCQRKYCCSRALLCHKHPGKVHPWQTRIRRQTCHQRNRISNLRMSLPSSTPCPKILPALRCPHVRASRRDSGISRMQEGQSKTHTQLLCLPCKTIDRDSQNRWVETASSPRVSPMLEQPAQLDDAIEHIVHAQIHYWGLATEGMLLRQKSVPRELWVDAHPACFAKDCVK